MIWFVLALVVLLILPLFFPVEIEVDTKAAIYRARWRGVVGVRVLPNEKGWHWFYQILFFEKKWRPSKMKSTKPVSGKEPQAQKNFLTRRQIWLLIKKCVMAFQCKRLFINWDTNDYISNAYLYPLAHLTSKHKRSFKINFAGKQEVDLLLQVRPIRLLLAFLAVLFFVK